MTTRRKFMWSAIGSAAAAAAYPTLFEPRWLERTRTRIELPRRGPTSMRILHLTDFHASWAVPMSHIEKAIDVGLAEKPDLVCLTGDFITHESDFDARHYISLLRRLSAAVPAFAVLGNHDGGPWSRNHHGYSDHTFVERMLEDAHIRLLHNNATIVSVGNNTVTLVGVGDLWSDEIDSERAFHGIEAKAAIILLSHNPDSKDNLRRFPWDLMLCGHTHGGQVLIPFEGPRYAPVRDRRFVSGLGKWDGREIYVSRGVGSLGGVRFRCRPEVTILDLA